jgi:hypothetical protein
MKNVINDIINNNKLAANQSTQDLTLIQNICLLEEKSLGNISSLFPGEELPQDNSLFPNELKGNIMYGY